MCLPGGFTGSFRKLEHDPEKWLLVFGKDHAQKEAKANALARATLFSTRAMPR
jgi:hypothetical protein